MGRLILHVNREAFCAAVEPRGHPEWSGVWRWPGDATAARNDAVGVTCMLFRPNGFVLGMVLLAIVAAYSGTLNEVQAADQPTPAMVAQDSNAPATADADGIPVPEPSAKALRYYQSGNVLWVAATLWGLAVPALLLFTGFSARLRDWAGAIGRRWFGTIAVYAVLYLAVVYLLDLPLSYYADFVREHAYDLSNQSLAQWLGDSLKSLLVTLVVAVATLWLPYLLLRKSPRRWWLYTALAAVPLLALLLLIQPVLIAPLFDDFGPMQDKALEAKILALADRAGIEGGRVLEVNKSEDTEAVNAYVAGLLDTKRIVLWDTLLAKLNPDQVLVVMGHEMGHYVLGHIWTLFALLCLLVLATLYAVHRSLGFLIRRYSHRFGFNDPADVASLPLLVLLFSAFFLLAQPMALAYSRHIERDADRFGLEITRDNHAMATAFTILQHTNLAYPRPGPLYVLWRSRHPSIAERIEFANRYRPWEQGQPLTYGRYFGEH
jgi:STE24 endopeptidase